MITKIIIDFISATNEPARAEFFNTRFGTPQPLNMIVDKLGNLLVTYDDLIVSCYAAGTWKKVNIEHDLPEKK
jgi:hypothetical protein